MPIRMGTYAHTNGRLVIRQRTDTMVGGSKNDDVIKLDYRLLSRVFM